MNQWFNNPEESDIQIELQSGAILHAHRIILRTHSEMFKVMLSCGMCESQTKVISMKTFPDVVVLSVIGSFYDKRLTTANMRDHWVNMFRFAHYLIADSVTAELRSLIPRELPHVEMIQLSVELNSNELMNDTVKQVIMELSRLIWSENLVDYCEEFRALDLEVYNNFRKLIVDNIPTNAHFLLLCLDCYYCEFDSDDITLLSTYLATIKFKHFIYDHFTYALKLPGIKTSPMLTNMISNMRSLRG